MIIVFLENNHKIDFCLFASLVYRGLYGARMRNGAEERTTSEHTKLASRCALSSCLPPPARSRGLPPCRVGWADRPMAATGRGIPSPARRTAPPKRPAPLAPWARAGKPSGRPAESPRRRRRRWQRRLRPGRRQWQRALQVSLTPALAPNPRPHSRRHPRPVPPHPPCPPPSAPTLFLSSPTHPLPGAGCYAMLPGAHRCDCPGDVDGDGAYADITEATCVGGMFAGGLWQATGCDSCTCS